MPKPKKERFVRFPPPAVLFRPIGIPSSHLRGVVLSLDEYEALRLVDHKGLDQAGAALELGVSRATCARILESARRKLADAVVNGCAIRIQGGSYRFAQNRHRCIDCGNMWESGLDETSGQMKCPVCSSPNVIDLAERAGWRDGPRRGPPGHGDFSTGRGGMGPRGHRGGRER
jgi:uncharacterized protein